ncbi:MAG: ATP-binding protein [Ruminococcaceae bacterium]|nr:ATP-binding protein [Oscillospiraceae bacterium]
MKQLMYILNASYAFDIRHDPLVMAFSCIANGFEANCLTGYSRICRILLSENKSLAQYLHDLLIYGKHEFMEKCTAPTEQQRKAVEFDIAAIKQLAQYSSEKLKAAMSDRVDSEVLSMLPDYEQGTFDYTADYFIEHYARYGSGIFAKYKAFSFDGEQLCPIDNTDPIRLSDLKNYEVQRNQVVENTVCFMSGKPAQNVLLYGDRGTGKSSTVKALLNEYDDLRMVELSKNDVGMLPKLFNMLKACPLRFIIMIDDLTFSENDDRFSVLKAVLEGSLAARPDNILIYATTNRRKIIKEAATEQLGGDAVSADAADESMSLADRFGLFVTFGKPDKAVYLDIVRKLAQDRGIAIGDEELCAAAERFALRRSGRSPRVARQFVDHIAARLELGMDY